MTAIESEITVFWKDLLRTSQNIQEADNFFHLGGTSIHAIHLQHMVNQKFKVDISFKNIFENPTIGTLSKMVESKIASAKTREQGGEKKNGAANYALENNLLPVTHREESLWLAYQLQDNKSVYNQVKAFRITGKLNKATLIKSLNLLVNYHENLRKKFVEVEGALKARIENDYNFSVRFVHHSEYASPDFEELADKILVEEVDKPFDLENDLPFRATLVEFENEFLLVLAAHHIISDEWSFAVLKSDLEKFYLNIMSAGNGNEIITQPSLSSEYFTYASKARQNLAHEKLQALQKFWLNYLNGRVEKLRLPYYRRSGQANSFEGAKEGLPIPRELVALLSELSSQKGVTLFMTFLAAFHVLLFRYTGNENIFTGVPFAGRDEKENENLVGFFVNTLLLVTSFSDDPDFSGLLNQVRENVLDAHEHQNMPFEILAHELRKQTGIDASEIIQVMFAFQNIPEVDLKLNGATGKYVEPRTTTSKFEMVVDILNLKEDGYKITIEYRKNLFSRSMIQRMLNHFLILLESIAKNPDVKISRLNFVSQEEKDLIVKKWNNTARNIPSTTIHELFEQQAERTPAQIALSYGDTMLTYGELNLRANQLAHHLIDLGISSEKRAGVMMNETEEAIISFLAILKAGGAYVPLDPSYPGDRLQYMIQNSDADLIITQEKFSPLLSGLSVKSVLLDKQGEKIFKGQKNNPAPRTTHNKLAYVIYTSGSTGKPKGVAVEHRGIVRLLVNTDWVTYNSQTRHLKTAAFSFDVSVMEIWGTLLAGGRLFLYPREDLLDHMFLKRKILEEKINTMFIASAWLTQLIEIDPSIFQPLKILISGGDKLSAKHLNKLSMSYPDIRIVNAYGPTENSVWSTSYPVTGWQIEPVLIGKPIPNSTVYILDDLLQLLPIGVIGEICVGGPGVARGYINNESKTKEKFVSDPFNPGGTLYKTGDIGRWLEDGNIEFHGRNDNQIKFRGFRIELGEIEHALVDHDSVDNCAVILSGSDEKIKQLVCFYTGASQIPDTELKAFLRKTLPDYMIPFRFIHMENLPLTSNGKINRLALAVTDS